MKSTLSFSRASACTLKPLSLGHETLMWNSTKVSVVNFMAARIIFLLSESSVSLHSGWISAIVTILKTKLAVGDKFLQLGLRRMVVTISAVLKEELFRALLASR